MCLNIVNGELRTTYLDKRYTCIMSPCIPADSQQKDILVGGPSSI